jgi:hypothetical protein
MNAEVSSSFATQRFAANRAAVIEMVFRRRDKAGALSYQIRFTRRGEGVG